MALNVLSQASAFNPGSELWVIPDAENSRWSVKIDWYLNYQVCKAQRHVTRLIDPFIENVLTQTELVHPQIKYSPAAPLLISSENLLPNKWVVVIPLQKNYAEWIQQISQSWSSLNEPSLRIFLPAGQSAGSFHELWQSHHKFEDFTVVLD